MKTIVKESNQAKEDRKKTVRHTLLVSAKSQLLNYLMWLA